MPTVTNQKTNYRNSEQAYTRAQKIIAREIFRTRIASPKTGVPVKR